MATYNGEKFILDQLDSIKNQTRKADELIIIDDGSTDSTPEIVQNYIKDNNLADTWHFRVNEVNKGWKRNFMEGIEETSGDLIFFADQDDIWLENKLEVYCKLAEENPWANLITCRVKNWDGTPCDITRIESLAFDRVELNKKERNFTTGNLGCAQAIRRSYYEHIKKYYWEGGAHDGYFWINAAMDNSLLWLKETSILRRVHGNNACMKKRTYESTLQDLGSGIRKAESSLRRLDDEAAVLSNIDEKRSMVMHRLMAFQARKKFLETGSFLTFAKIFFCYFDIYSRKRQYIGDFKLWWDNRRKGNKRL